ncbi:hypothetical protein [Ensifer canadensis]
MLRYGIRSRLPFETVVASKSGRGKRGRMDAGLVYRNSRPLLRHRRLHRRRAASDGRWHAWLHNCARNHRPGCRSACWDAF